MNEHSDTFSFFNNVIEFIGNNNNVNIFSLLASRDNDNENRSTNVIITMIICETTMMMIIKFIFLQLQTFLGFHDFFNDTFRHGLLAR